MKFPIGGYAPDLDPVTEGVIVDCQSFVPSEKGMTAAPSAQTAGVSALPAQCYGAAAVRYLDDSTRTFAGTLTKMYEAASGAFNDVTRASADYNLGSDQFWRFAQFGNTTLAAAKTEILQFSNSGAFDDVNDGVNDAPKASFVETVGQFVFLADTNESSFGDSPNRWWCSAIGTYDDWVPSIATQSASGILTSIAGPITGMRRFGSQIVIYKGRGMYIGTYVGAPIIWDFQEVPGQTGAFSNECIVNIGSADNPVHLFMGADDFWRFDGARPVPIGAPVRKTVYADLDASFAYKSKALHDRENTRVYFYYPSLGGSGAIDSCVVYNYRTNQWGRDDRLIEAALEYVQGGVTYDTLDTVAATYDTLPTNISYDSPFWNAGQPVTAIFNTSHALLSLDGIPTTSSFTTGEFGDDFAYYLLQRVKPRWIVKPTSATMENFYKEAAGDVFVTDTVTTMSESRFDVLRSARWHQLQFEMTGAATLNQLDVMYQADGEE
jgi:hypothetical protein